MSRGLGDGLLRLCNGAWRDNDGDTVDIVEVVRCKECKHYDCGNGHRPWCNHLNGLDEMHDDDYCSFGERRAENE